MGIERPWFRRAIVWSLGYLWTAAAALAISYALNWQYDGDLGWWLVMAYSYPAVAIALPIRMAGDQDIGVIGSLLVLMALTIAAAITLRRFPPKADYS